MSFTFTSGDLIEFYYNLSHPNKKRLLYITGDHIINDTQGWIGGYELDEVTGNRKFKRFIVSGLVRIKKLPLAKLPLEANNFAEPIFAKMLGCKEDDVYTYDMPDELIGTFEKNEEILARVVSNTPGRAAIWLDDLKLSIRDNRIFTAPLPEYTAKAATKEELIQYLQNNL